MLNFWINLVKIYRYLVIQVAKEIHLHPNLGDKSKIKEVLKTIEFLWAEVVNKLSFPFIGCIDDLVPKWKAASSLTCGDQ